MWKILKDYQAPIITTTLHLTTLLFLVITTSSLLDFSKASTAAYWIIAFLSLFSYFNAAFRNPGFIWNRGSSSGNHSKFFDGVEVKHKKNKTSIGSQLGDNMKITINKKPNEDNASNPISPNGTLHTLVSDMRVAEIEDENAGPICRDMLSSPDQSEAALGSFESSSDEEIIDEILEDEVSNEDEDENEDGPTQDENIPETIEQNRQGPGFGPGFKENGFWEEKTQDPDSDIISETRYWTVCNLEQPVRAKHWKECNKCVRLHDHHCPWLGTWVGEKNRFFFYWYLCFQWTELWWSLISWLLLRSYDDIIGVYVLAMIIHIIAVMVIVLFTLMVTLLLGFHTYLAMTNKTTWETVSGAKISYLKKWPTRLGSPFSRGCLKNLYIYCFSWFFPPRQWALPSVIPEKGPKHCICC